MKTVILFQLNQLGFSGTEKAIYTFIKNLDKNKYSNKIFFYSDIGTLTYYRRKLLSIFGGKYLQHFNLKYNINFARKKDFEDLIGKDNVYIGTSKKFLDVCNSNKIDIIHFSRGSEEDFYTSLVDKIPNNIKLVETSIFGKNSNSKYINRLSSIFFVSHWLMEQSPWVNLDQAKVLYLPIPKPISTDTFREKYNIPLNAIVLGRITRPFMDNGEFILNILNNTIDNNTFYLAIGSSEYLIEQTKNNKNIIHIKPTTDEMTLSTFYNTLDILLHYRKEGETFGMNIADAMIHGKPVISHYSLRDNAQAELILGDKNSGIVVKDDINEYIIAVKTLIDNNNLRIEYGINAKEKANKLFAADKTTNILESYYKKIIN